MSPNGLRTSRSTGGDALETERWSVDVEHPVGAVDDDESDANGSWDPLATVMADDEEAPTSESEDGSHERLSDRVWGDEFDEAAMPSDERPTFSDDLEELQFTRLSEAATLPTRAHDGDAGLDLYASEGAHIGPGQRVSVGTGLAVAVPQGLVGLVTPRSGMAIKHGVSLVNTPGVIDSGYRGELRVLLLNTDSSSEFKVAAGDRIAQLLLIPIATASPLEAEGLDETSRGGGGFGSSGA